MGARVATNLAIKAHAPRAAVRWAAVTDDLSDATTLRLALVDALAASRGGSEKPSALRYLADLSIDDVARTMGVSSGTVKQSVHRALQRCATSSAPIWHS